MMSMLDNLYETINKEHYECMASAFAKCGYNIVDVLAHHDRFSMIEERRNDGFGYKHTVFLGDPSETNAIALFEIIMSVNVLTNRIDMRYNILKEGTNNETT